jgi:hypothetical protein
MTFRTQTCCAKFTIHANNLIQIEYLINVCSLIFFLICLPKYCLILRKSQKLFPFFSYLLVCSGQRFILIPTLVSRKILQEGRGFISIMWHLSLVLYSAQETLWKFGNKNTVPKILSPLIFITYIRHRKQLILKIDIETNNNGYCFCSQNKST